MNYDLAMMALEGLTRSPMSVTHDGNAVVIEGNASSFRELARLCLLLGSADGTDDAFELQPGVHVTGSSPGVHLRLI